MTNKHVKYSDIWLDDVRNRAYAAYQDVINFYPGLGERWSSGTEGGLNLIESRTVFGANGKDPRGLFLVTDHFGINLLTTAPRNNYENGEFPALSAYSQEVLEARRIYWLLQSLGGFGGAMETGKSAALANVPDAIVWMAPGPGKHKDTAKNLAAAKVPNWFIVAEDDTHAGTYPGFSYDLHNAILALGGISFLTVIKGGTLVDPHSNLFGPLINGWDGFPPSLKLSTNTSLGGIAPTMGIYQWMMANAKGKSVVAPNGVAASPAPAPAPAPTPIPGPVVIDPAPAPTPRPDIPPIVLDPNPKPVPTPIPMPTAAATIVGFGFSIEPNRRSQYVETYYSDGSKILQKAAVGDLLYYAYVPVTPKGKERVSVSSAKPPVITKIDKA